MEVVAAEPFRAGSFVWQPRPGAHVQTVVCKVTFDLAPGESRPASAPARVAAFDEHAGGDERRGLAAASDFVPFKTRPEVIVTGSAFAPGGRAVRHLIARVAMQEMDKAIAIHGDRHFSLDGALHEAAPFAKMPLSWDRAAGGPDTMNPAGVVMGADAEPDAWGRVALPNLEPLGAFVASRADIVAPAGFGPLAPAWPTRRLRLHRHAPAWDPVRWMERPLPADFEGAYFQSAPSDQWVTEIPPDVRILLENLHPHVPQLSTRPARMVPTATVVVAGTATPLALRCDTLAIDTDRQVLMFVYRGQLPLSHPQQSGRIVIAGPGRTEPRGETRDDEQSITMDTAESQPPPTVPANPADDPALASLPPAERAKVAARLAQLSRMGVVSARATISAVVEAEKPVLPFAHEEAASGEGGTAAKEAGTEDTAEPANTAALPFRPTHGAKVGASALGRSMRLQPAGSEPPAPPPPPVAPPPRVATGDTDRPPATLDDARGLPPMAYRPPQFMAEPPRDWHAPVAPTVPLSSPEQGLSPFVPPPSPQVDTPVPPAFGVPVSPVLPAEPEADAGEIDEPPAPGEDGSPAAPPPEEAALPIEQFTLERCARIEASLACRPDHEIVTLEEENLSAELWNGLKAHWEAVLGAELQHGKSVQNRAYDTAYVSQIEAERGPIGPAEYGRLTVAVERSRVDVVLAELGIPHAAVIRIQRVWLHRMLANPKVAKAARGAVQAAREAE